MYTGFKDIILTLIYIIVVFLKDILYRYAICTILFTYIHRM